MNQPFHPRCAYSMGGACRMNARAVKRLADIYIAQARNDSLIQQRRFYGRAPCPRPTARPDRSHRTQFPKGSAARLMPAACGLPCVAVGAQIHRTKAARVVKGHRAPPLSMWKITWSCFSSAGWSKWNLPGTCGAASPDTVMRPRHAQVHDQRFCPVQIGQQIFRPPPQRQNPRAGQAFGHIRSERASADRARRNSARAITAPSIAPSNPRRNGFKLLAIPAFAPQHGARSHCIAPLKPYKEGEDAPARAKRMEPRHDQ